MFCLGCTLLNICYLNKRLFHNVMIVISPKKVLIFLALFMLGFQLVNTGVQFSTYILDRGGLWGFSRLFDIDMENNIPAWYSSTALLICGILFGLISAIKYQKRDRFFRHWLGLSGIFAWLSLDESASIHEMFIPLGEILDTSGFLEFFWVVPALLAVSVVAIIYKQFLFCLPLKMRQRLLTSILIFLTGAVGLEMLGGFYISVFPDVEIWSTSSDWIGLGFELILALEEFLEMIGVAGLIYTLLSYISEEIGSVTIHVSEQKMSIRDRQVMTKNTPHKR
jgi:hypothetical protein